MLAPRRHTAALWLTLILLIVWSIPHTVALRYTLMTGLALCVFSVPAVRQAVAAQWRSQPALWIYLALSAWLLIQIPTVAMHSDKNRLARYDTCTLPLKTPVELNDGSPSTSQAHR